MKKVIEQDPSWGNITIESSTEIDALGISIIQDASVVGRHLICVEKEKMREVALAICPELEQEKIDFAVGFADWISGCMYDKCYGAGGESFWHDGNERIANTTTELIELYQKHLENER